MKALCKRVLFFTIVVFLFSACDDIMSLSTKGKLIKFELKSHSPQEVQLGTPEINGDTVTIPLLYGKYLFPLVISADVESSNGTTIRDLKKDSIVFNNPSDIINFYIMTESGMPIKQYIVLNEIPRSNNANLASVEATQVESTDQIISHKAYFDGDNEYTFYLLQGAFPVTLTPQITLNDSATIIDNPSGTPITFARENNRFPVIVQAADGSKKEWFLRVKRAISIDSEYNLPSSIIRSLTFRKEELSCRISETSGQNLVVADLLVDNEKGKITAVIKNETANEKSSFIKFPLKLNIAIPTSDERQLAGLDTLSSILYNSFSGSLHFYLYNPIEGYKKEWSLGIQQWLNSANNVTQFKITKSQPSTIIIDRNVEINNTTGIITINIEDGQDKLPLTLSAQVTPSEDATVKDFVSTMVFNDLRTTHSFKIQAEDGTEKTWTIRLRYKGELSNEATVLSFTILDYTSSSNPLTGSKVVIDPTAIIDTEAKKIKIEVLDWARYMPLNVTVQTIISEGATYTSGSLNGTVSIRFNSLSSVYPFTIQSQDGSYSESWQVVLVNKEKPKSNLASLESFSVAINGSGYALESVDKNDSKKEIVIYLSEKGTGTFTITPTLQISSNALLFGITNRVAIPFNSISEKKNFTILSESEVVQNEWTIRIAYAPQIPNWTLNEWTNNTTPWSPGPGLGWATSNINDIVTTIGVTKTTGQDGSNAALLKSQKVDAVIVREMAAASLFLGKFVFNLSDKNDPKKMTWFGIPFTGRPTAISFNYKYKTSKLFKVVSNKFVEQSGYDEGSCNVQLLNYQGTGAIEYHDKGEANVKVIASLTKNSEGKSEFTITNQPEWKTVTLPIVYDPLMSGLQPTHLHVVFSTSRFGDDFLAGDNSELTIDNVKLIY